MYPKPKDLTWHPDEHARSHPFVAICNHYLHAFPIDQGQRSSSETTEILQIGMGCAQDLSWRLLRDPEMFIILYSGYRSRREKGWHVDIVLLGNRWRKAWFYAVQAGKSIKQALGSLRSWQRMVQTRKQSLAFTSSACPSSTMRQPGPKRNRSSVRIRQQTRFSSTAGGKNTGPFPLSYAGKNGQR